MNGITKEAFMKAKGELKDEMLYDMLSEIYRQLSPKRTLMIALMGAVIAITLVKSPDIALALFSMW